MKQFVSAETLTNPEIVCSAEISDLWKKGATLQRTNHHFSWINSSPPCGAGRRNQLQGLKVVDVSWPHLVPLGHMTHELREKRNLEDEALSAPLFLSSLIREKHLPQITEQHAHVGGLWTWSRKKNAAAAVCVCMRERWMGERRRKEKSQKAPQDYKASHVTDMKLQDVCLSLLPDETWIVIHVGFHITSFWRAPVTHNAVRQAQRSCACFILFFVSEEQKWENICMQLWECWSVFACGWDGN